MLYRELTAGVKEEAGTTQEAVPAAQAGNCWGLHHGGRGGGGAPKALMMG